MDKLLRPALRGGPPVCPEGPPSWPPADPAILAALETSYQEGSWGKYHGPAVPALEAALRQYHNVEHVLLCGSGTYAIELALRACKVGPGEEAVLAGYDFPGNFLSIHALGAAPVLVDLEPGGWQLDAGQLEASLRSSCKAVLVSHLHGGVVPMNRVLDLARSHGIKVIEDAAQCPGAKIDGKKAGTWGDIGILSFGGSKLLSAGRGGALLFRHADDYQRARAHHLRGNLVCPLSELQAAVLLPQLAKLDARNQERRQRALELQTLLDGIPGLRLFQLPPGDHVPGYYKVGMQFDGAAFGLDRARFLQAMRAEGIALDEGFPALHVGRSPKRYRTAGTLAEATRAHQGCVVLHHPVLLSGEEGVRQVAAALRKVHAWRGDLAQ